MIGIVNYGLGNLSSVRNALEFLKREAEFVTRPEDLDRAEALVLPGVGHFVAGMENLLRGGLAQALYREVVDRGKPILGICLGMQLMCASSAEAPGVDGLGWFDLSFELLKSRDLRTPNIGWNDVSATGDSRLLAGLKTPTFYFVHSYYADGLGSGVSSYIDADVKVAASLERGNMFATQFHPEKSQQDGLKVLSNFLEIVDHG
ncbi:imidazole glycerol phosphate synthase subunit HisH [Desulfocurvus sp. DL9XJH121]